VIAIINYDMGNLKSVSKALEKVGAKVVVTRDIKQIKKASKIVLPGVGAYTRCMENLTRYGLVDVIKEEIKSGKWFLGICLGLQLLFEESEEFGPTKGLGLLKGSVKRFPVGAPLAAPLGVPHIRAQQAAPLPKIPMIGWNQIKKTRADLKLFRDVPDETYFYFVHSYFVSPKDKDVVATTTDYEGSFCSSVQKDHVLACQFHPEKSQKWGLKVLENFVGL